MNDGRLEDGSKEAEIGAPLLVELNRQQCEELLRRHRLGRLAFTLHDRVQIVPIHFVYDDEWIYCRTSAGAKLPTLERNKSVAFEIDQSDGLFSWKSVVVHGPLYLIGRAGDADEQVFSHAVSLLRRLVPDTLGEADPVPFRNQLFRIHAAEITGRSASPGGGDIREPSALPRSAARGQPEADAGLLDKVRAAVRSTLGESRVDIDAFEGVVVLGGALDDFAKRRAVEEVVKGLDGVLVVVQQIESHSPERTQLTPVELGLSAARAIREIAVSKANSLKVVVENRWLRLEGTSPEADRQRALDALRDLQGIRGVIDRTSRER